MKFYVNDQHSPGDIRNLYPFAWIPTKVDTKTGPAWVWLELFERQMRYVGHGKWYELSRNDYNPVGCGL